MKIFREIEEFLISYCGISEKFLDRLADEYSEQGIHFFKPYSSKRDFFKRAASVVTTPIAFTSLSVEMALRCFLHTGNALFRLIKLDPEGARENIKNAALALCGVFIMIVAAVVGPVFNLVDFFGSMVTTMMGLKQVPNASPQVGNNGVWGM